MAQTQQQTKTFLESVLKKEVIFKNEPTMVLWEGGRLSALLSMRVLRNKAVNTLLLYVIPLYIAAAVFVHNVSYGSSIVGLLLVILLQYSGPN